MRQPITFLLAAILTTLLPTTIAQISTSPYSVNWFYPTSGRLFGIVINFNDVIFANWESNINKPWIWVWGPPFNDTTGTPIGWQQAAVDSTGQYAFTFAGTNLGAKYNGTYPFPAHLELTNGDNFTGGVNADVFTVTSSPAAPRTYALTYTIVPSTTSSSMSTSTASTTTDSAGSEISSSASPTSSPAAVGDAGISGGTIAGIVIALVGGIALIIGGAWWFLRHRRRKDEKDAAAVELSLGPPPPYGASMGAYTSLYEADGTGYGGLYRSNGPHELPGQAEVGELPGHGVASELRPMISRY